MFFVHEDVFNIKVYKSMGDLIPILIFFPCFFLFLFWDRTIVSEAWKEKSVCEDDNKGETQEVSQ